MGSAGTEWDTADVLTKARLNQKNIFVGTGSQINALTAFAGQHAFCTSAGSGFLLNHQYVRNTANTAWTEITDIFSSYGTGTLGSVTISSATSIADADNVLQYTNLTVNASQTLTLGTANQRPRKWIIFATESITVNGTINCSGRGAVGATGGTGGSGGIGGALGANNGTAGSQGSIGSIATGGYNQNSNVGLVGSVGGNGGSNTSNGSTGGAGGALGTLVSSAGIPSGYTEEENFTSKFLVLNNLSNWGMGGNGGSGGSGGGGGGGGPGAAGGDGGSGGTGGSGGYGGGSVTLVAPTITFGGSASINCAANAGSNGSNGSVGGTITAGSGSTAGGAGGVFGVSSGAGTAAANSSVSASGGGGGGGAGGAGGAGTDGFVGIVGITIPSQVDLNSKSTAYLKLRFVA